MVLKLGMDISFKSRTHKAHFHSELRWNTSLGSVMTMRKSFTGLNINSLLWGRVIMMRFSELLRLMLEKVVLSKLSWYMPHVLPNDQEKLALYKTVESQSSLPVGYRMIQCDSISVPQTKNFTWWLSVKSAPEKPRWIIAAF